MLREILTGPVLKADESSEGSGGEFFARHGRRGTIDGPGVLAYHPA
jgi:hypothetical protein